MTAMGDKQPLKMTFEEEKDLMSLEAQKEGCENCFQRIPKRYVLAIMGFFGFGNVYTLRTNLSVGIVAMVNNHTKTVNGTEVTVPATFDWDSRTQGLILSSFFYGYIFTQMPGGFLARRFGGKYLFGCGILMTAILTILTPALAKWDPRVLIAARIIEGLFEGVTFPAMHTIWSKWAPPLERSKLAITAFSGSYFGTVVSMIGSGLLAEHVSWESLFYVFGALAILWFVLWIYLTAESPAVHPTISPLEAEYIERSIGFSDIQASHHSPPWKSIFTSLPVWAIVFAHFGENWGFYTLLTLMPTFMNDVLEFSLQKAGFLAAVPYAVMSVTAQFGGQLADWLRGKLNCSTTVVRKVFNGVAFTGQAIFLLILAFLMEPKSAIVCLTIAVGLGGLCYSGFAVNHLDIAPQFAGLLMGISNTVATIPGIVSPSLAGEIAKDRTADEWRIIFYIAVAIYLAAMLFYVTFASGETQEWAKIPLGYEPHVQGDTTSMMSQSTGILDQDDPEQYETKK